LNLVLCMVSQQVKTFHGWLKTQYNEDENLGMLNLDLLNDQVVAKIVGDDPDGKRQSGSAKDSGSVLPLFNGNQPAYQNWHRK